MNTLGIEKRAFLARLRSDPAFLLKHAGALSMAVGRKVRTRLMVSLLPIHRGTKGRPDWLKAEGHTVSRSRMGAVSAATLPEYPWTPSAHCSASLASSMTTGATDDPEDYFAEHRWCFLLEPLLEGAVDWRKCLDEAMRWVANHSDKADRAWEPYSACERVSNLLVLLSTMPFELRGNGLPSGLIEFLDDSMEWIYRHIEYYGSSRTNNHILNNARALVMAGVAMGNASALSAGMRIFREFLPALIMSGGFLRERSSHYQLIVLNWMLDAWRFLVAGKAQTSEDAEFLRGYIERMVGAADMLCTDNRLIAVVGDVSPDATPAASLSRLSRLYPEFWPVTGESTRLFELKDGWFRISCGNDVVLGNFPQGQYPPGFPTHGHGDLTSFVWSHDGEEILGDSGRYRYTPDDVSLFQKSAVGHNVPVVNGFSPLSETLVANGLWCPVPYASAALEITGCGSEVVLTHDGFFRATPVTRHTRKIAVQENSLLVVDSFHGQGNVEVAFCWHFGEGFESFDSVRMVATGNRGEISLSVEGLSGLPGVTHISGTAPGSWMSRVYGQKLPALGICLCWRVELPAVISSKFSLSLCAE